MLLQNNAGAIKSQKGYAPITDKKKADGVKRTWFFAAITAKSTNCRPCSPKQPRAPLRNAVIIFRQISAIGNDLPEGSNCSTFFSCRSLTLHETKQPALRAVVNG